MTHTPTNLTVRDKLSVAGHATTILLALLPALATAAQPCRIEIVEKESGWPVPPLLFFEGTYTIQFSGNKQPTPRYDYNQILYRLDLSHPKLLEQLK